MPPYRLELASAFILLAGAASSAASQCMPGGPPSPAPVSRAITGIVLDADNRPIENADVLIRRPVRQARTNRDGRFQLSELDSGTYDVVVRRIGYVTTAQEYAVGPAGAVARFCLDVQVRMLAPSITAVQSGGLWGIIGDSLLKPLPDAEVRAIGAGEHARTDSAGAFHLGLKRGTYAIVVSKPGYARQLISVTIPKDSGRQITAFLGSPPRNANRMAAMFDAMRERMLWATPSRSGIMSNEDLMNTSTDLRGAAQRLARSGIAPDCPALINGGPYWVPLNVLDKRDVGMLEAYGLSAPRVRRGGPQRPVNTPCGARIYVWMKP